MAKYICLMVGCVLLSTTSHGVPLDKIDDGIIDRQATDIDPKLDEVPYDVEETAQKEEVNAAGLRHKRFYNYFDYNNNYDVNPIFPVPFHQNIHKRHQSHNFGNYGSEDSFDIILRKLQEIASATRDRTYLPPPPIQIPIPTYIPILYVPKISCECTSGDNPLQSNDKPSPTKDNIPSNQPVDNSKRPGVNKTIPSFTDRVTGMEDTRQIWASSDVSENEYDDDSDGARPISFNPVKLDKPLSKPPPPFDHGSVQAGLKPVKPNKAAADTPIEVSEDESTQNPLPTTCERAAVSCCHQPQVTFACFKSQSCVDRSFIANACLPKVLLGALQKFERMYEERLILSS